MSGIALGELECSDMLDVIHYILEEDLIVASKEEADYRTHVRNTLYRDFYNREYAYGRSSSGVYASGNAIDLPLDDEFNPKPFDPDSGPKPSKPKPYIPPTKVNPDSVLPFGKNIDAPLG